MGVICLEREEESRSWDSVSHWFWYYSEVREKTQSFFKHMTMNDKLGQTSVRVTSCKNVEVKLENSDLKQRSK